MRVLRVSVDGLPDFYVTARSVETFKQTLENGLAKSPFGIVMAMDTVSVEPDGTGGWRTAPVVPVGFGVKYLQGIEDMGHVEDQS